MAEQDDKSAASGKTGGKSTIGVGCAPGEERDSAIGICAVYSPTVTAAIAEFCDDSVERQKALTLVLDGLVDLTTRLATLATAWRHASWTPLAAAQQPLVRELVGRVAVELRVPVVQAAKRRDAFFQATRKLGFTFRSGGGNVAYIQIPKARGKVLLNLLNSSLATYDKRKERLLEASASSGPKEFIFSSAVKREAQPVKNLKFTPNE